MGILELLDALGVVVVVHYERRKFQSGDRLGHALFAAGAGGKSQVDLRGVDGAAEQRRVDVAGVRGAAALGDARPVEADGIFDLVRGGRFELGVFLDADLHFAHGAVEGHVDGDVAEFAAVVEVERELESSLAVGTRAQLRLRRRESDDALEFLAFAPRLGEEDESGGAVAGHVVHVAHMIEFGAEHDAVARGAEAHFAAGGVPHETFGFPEEHIGSDVHGQAAEFAVGAPPRKAVELERRFEGVVELERFLGRGGGGGGAQRGERERGDGLEKFC